MKEGVEGNVFCCGELSFSLTLQFSLIHSLAEDRFGHVRHVDRIPSSLPSGQPSHPLTFIC